MIIQVGIGSFRELEFFLKKGAGEFYTGIETIPSHVEGAPNFKNTKEFFKAKEILNKENKKLFFAANEIRGDKFRETLHTIIELSRNGIDGLIIKDLALLEKIKQKKIKTLIILSTLSQCLNSKAAAFYRKNYGVKRMALPEQITSEEAKNINKILETEVFLKHRESCKNFNGLCFLDCHGGITTPCHQKYNKTFTMPGFTLEENLRNLYRYYKNGTKIIKIGRSPMYHISKAIFFEAKNLIEILKNSKNEEEFLKYSLKFIRNYNKVYKKISEKFGIT